MQYSAAAGNRTPHENVFASHVRSARIPTETGHVGLRPRTEPTVIAVEAGVVNVRLMDRESVEEIFIGMAGGLLMCDDNTATLLTPLAVIGDDEENIVERIEVSMRRPNSEWEARAALSKLEGHILSELRREQTKRRPAWFKPIPGWSVAAQRDWSVCCHPG